MNTESMKFEQFEISIKDLADEHLLDSAIETKRNQLSTEKLDMSFGEIISMYQRGEIIINPEYQRLFRWTEFQKTRFLESLLLGIPVPPIFVAEDQNGKWELVDGLQRISTVLSFFDSLKDDKKNKNKWTLTSGELISELNGYNIDTIPIKHQLRIKRSYCRIEITKWNEAVDMRYELFNRLNTGGAHLTDQEIRNCIFRGIDQKLNTIISDLGNNVSFLDLISISDDKKEQLYNEELVLRFFTIYDEWDKIDSNFSIFLTDYMKRKVKEQKDFSEIAVIFVNTVNLLLPLGKKIFRFSNNQFSTSLYDAIFVGIAKNIDKYLIDNGTLLADAKINELIQLPEFKKYIGADSSSKSRIKKRTEIAINHFGD